MGYQGGRRYGPAGYRSDSDRYRSDQDRYRGYQGNRGYRSGYEGRRPPADYDYEERGFFNRAGDEVRSWFGDEDAERRREYDEFYNRRYGDPRDQSSRIGYASAANPTRYTPNQGSVPFTGQDSGFARSDYGERISYGPQSDFGSHHDSNYHAWRQERIAELDRDYDEYQRENRSRFNNEFGTWRNRRGQQRSLLSQVKEHMEVVGSDGTHVGTVDKCSGDRIILTKNDQDAGGVHHSIPSRWIDTVEGQTITLEKSAEEAQSEWRAERDQQAIFGERGQRDQEGGASRISDGRTGQRTY